MQCTFHYQSNQDECNSVQPQEPEVTIFQCTPPANSLTDNRSITQGITTKIDTAGSITDTTGNIVTTRHVAAAVAHNSEMDSSCSSDMKNTLDQLISLFGAKFIEN